MIEAAEQQGVVAPEDPTTAPPVVPEAAPVAAPPTEAPDDDADADDAAECTVERFQAAVDTAMALGPLPKEQVREAYEPVREVYRGLDKKGRAAALRWLTERGKKLVLQGKFAEAQSAVMILEQAKRRPAPANPIGPRPKANPTPVVVDQVASIALGYAVAVLLAAENPHLDEDWETRRDALVTAAGQDAALAYARWLQNRQKGEEPMATEVQKAAARVALGRSPKGQGRKPRPDPKPAAPAEPGAVTDADVAAFNAAIS